jgi:hypothetical protein
MLKALPMLIIGKGKKNIRLRGFERLINLLAWLNSKKKTALLRSVNNLENFYYARRSTQHGTQKASPSFELHVFETHIKFIVCVVKR